MIISSQEGNTTVIMATVIIVLLAVAGIIIDTGLVIEGKLKLHAATKAAAKATIEAYDEVIWENEGRVVLNQDEAESYASIYLNYNLAQAQLISVIIPTESPNKAEIKTKLKVEFIFMKIFGIEDCEVGATITAIGG